MGIGWSDDNKTDDDKTKDGTDGDKDNDKQSDDYIKKYDVVHPIIHDEKGLNDVLFKSGSGLVVTSSEYTGQSTDADKQKIIHNIVDAFIANNSYASRNYMKIDGGKGLQTQCKSIGYIDQWTVNADDMMGDIMEVLQSINGESEDVKKAMYSYYFMYNDFKAPEKISGVQDVIKTWLSIGYQYASEAFPASMQLMGAGGNFKYSTTFSSGSGMKYTTNTTADAETYEGTAIAMIKGVYTYMASVLLNEFFSDCAKQPTDTSRLMRDLTADNLGGGKYQNNDTKVKNVLDNTIKPALVDLWGQLIISFWIPRIYDCESIKSNNTTIDVRKKIILYMTAPGTIVTDSNVWSKVEAVEENARYWAKFITFHDIVVNDKLSSTDSDQANRYSNPYMGNYLQSVGDYTKLAQSTKDAFAHGMGLLKKSNNDQTYKYDTANFATVLQNAEKNSFYNGTNVTTYVLKMPDKSTFKQLSLEPCECRKYNILKTVAVIVTLICIAILLYIGVAVAQRGQINREQEQPTVWLSKINQ